MAPDTLTNLPQWVCWRMGRGKDGKPTKRPIDPHRDGRALASSTDPATWTTYEHAKNQAERWGIGYGFVFTTRAGIVGVDLDKVRNAETGETEPWALETIKELDSYTELSPSGTGYHILALGELPPNGRKKAQVEMYDSGRFFTVTGQHVSGTPQTIKPRPEAVLALHRRVFGEPPKPKQVERKPTVPTVADDRDLLELIRASRQGAKFDRLWRGDMGAYASPSEADLALCSMLAFWTGGNAGRMDALFRQSGLYRDKWDEKRGQETYGEMTLTTALEGTTEYYTPGGNGDGPDEPDWLQDAPFRDTEPPEPYDTVPSKRPVKVWSLAELLDADFPEPVWVIEGLLPAGLALLAGRPKQGKSFMGLQLALAVGAGGRFLGRSVAQGRALYIALEDSEGRIQRRLLDMGALSLDGLSIAFGWPALNTPEGIEALADAIEQNGLRLIAIDTLARAIKGRLDWDKLAEVTALLGPLQELALATNCCILLIDHHRKPGATGRDVIDDVMGSTGKSAICDTVMGLYRNRGDASTTLAITGRDVEDSELAVTFDGRTLCWQLDEDSQGVRAGTVQADILNLLEDFGGEASTNELAEALGVKRPNVSRELQELVAKRAVVRGGKRGKETLYLLPSLMDDTVDTHDTAPARSVSTVSCVSPIVQRKSDAESGNGTAWRRPATVLEALGTHSGCRADARALALQLRQDTGDVRAELERLVVGGAVRRAAWDARLYELVLEAETEP